MAETKWTEEQKQAIEPKEMAKETTKKSKIER